MDRVAQAQGAQGMTSRRWAAALVACCAAAVAQPADPEVLLREGRAAEAFEHWRTMEAALPKPRGPLQLATLRMNQARALLAAGDSAQSRIRLHSAVLLLCPDVLERRTYPELVEGLQQLIAATRAAPADEPDALDEQRRRCILARVSSPGPTAAAEPGALGASDAIATRNADLGSQAFERREFATALRLWRRAEAALPAPPDPAALAELRYRQGRALVELQRPDEAVRVLQAAAQAQRALPPSPEAVQALGQTLHTLADATAAGREPLLARGLYEQARAQRQAANDRQGELRTLVNHALLLGQLGEWGRASQLLDTGAALMQRHEIAAADRARWLAASGVVRALLGQWDAAVQALQEGAALSRTAGDALGSAEALRNLAYVHLERDQPEQALALYRQALALLPAEARQPRAVALNGAGYALVQMQQAADALPLLKQAVALQRATRDTLELGRTLESLGSALVQLGRAAPARAAYLEGLALARHRGAPEDQREVLFSLARLALAQGQPRLAVLQLKQAVQLSEALRAGAAPVLSREQRGALSRRLAEPYKLLARLLIEQGRLLEGEQVLFALKEAELVDYTRGDSTGTPAVTLTADEKIELDALAATDEGLADIQRRLQEHARGRQPLSELALADLQERESALLERQAALLAAIDERLASAGRVALTPALQQLQLAARAAELSSHPLGEPAVMLLLVPEERITTVLIAGAFGARSLQLPVGLTTLAPLVAALRSAIIGRGDHKPAARSLHQLIVEPIERELARAGPPPAMWMLFLTDELRYLPFAALLDADGRHLAEKVRLASLVTPSLDQLLAEPRPWTVSAFGSTQAAPAHRLAALPAARDELRMLVRGEQNPQGLLPGRSLLDAQFTRSAWVGAFQRIGLPAPGATVLHVASHFKALPGDWNNSFLLLGGNEEFRVSELANAANWSLRHLDLVTLSACATELNAQASGRELEGFGTLLHKRGARAVIGTLWPVQDAGTALWMRQFYGARGETRAMSKAAAMQRAQTALLNGSVRADNPAIDLRHPYYWAPFVLMGNWL